MINYAFVFFLPGAAGNFFSRCLSLASDQSYGWIPSNLTNPRLSAAEKLRLYSYSSSTQFNDWKKFEGQLVQYNSKFEHWKLPDDSIAIWSEHPRYDLINSDLVGIDDKHHLFYINPGDNFEWVILNSLYKNSYIDVHWLREGQLMSQDSNVNQINLENIITGPDTLWIEIQKIYTILQKECSNKELVTMLWQQWIKTTLKSEQFVEFKNSIGFNI
jgi:hypothetical protein